MKKLLTIFCLVLITSYSYSQDVSENLLVKKDGTVYKIKSDKLFTGTLVEYHDNGQLRVRATFKDGKENGLYEGYYKNGLLHFRTTHKNGIPGGLWEGFYEDGQLKERGNIKDLEQDGLWEYFDEEGNSTKIEEYKDGVLQE
jgi:antitoxin component YwqK of YwqJK toxin-antitoxin module